jgi:hypothetical protein
MVPDRDTGITCQGNRVQEVEGETYGPHHPNPMMRPPHPRTGYMVRAMQ